MNLDQIKSEFDQFIEYPEGSDGLYVTTVSAQLFARHIACMVHREYAAEFERLKNAAATAEKWRGMALAKFGDGRTVQEVQREAAEHEREECALICDAVNNHDNPMTATDCADAIRKRSAERNQ